MKAMTVEDLDARARQALKYGGLESLSLDLHLTSQCHPTAGLKNTRAYEGDNMMLTCSECNLFVANLKIAKE
jgi:hypothetical protein